MISLRQNASHIHFFCNICNATHYEGLTAKCGASFFLINVRVQINWNKSVSFFKKGISGMHRMISFVLCSDIASFLLLFDIWGLRLVYCFYRSLAEACCLCSDKKLRQTHGVIFRIFHVSFQISQGTAIGHRRYSC